MSGGLQNTAGSALREKTKRGISPKCFVFAGRSLYGLGPGRILQSAMFPKRKTIVFYASAGWLAKVTSTSYPTWMMLVSQRERKSELFLAEAKRVLEKG
eukprot:5340263-Pleurochrysis_carterae.AAC.1